MEHISINTLIENAKKGRISRPVYVHKIIHQMLQTPVDHLVTRYCNSEGHIKGNFDDVDCIMEHLDIPISQSSKLNYMDLVFYISKYLESNDEASRARAFETVDHFFMMARSIDNNRFERSKK